MTTPALFKDKDHGGAEFTLRDFLSSLWESGKSVENLLRGFNSDFERLDCFVNGKRLKKQEFATVLSLVAPKRRWAAEIPWRVFDPAIPTGSGATPSGDLRSPDHAPAHKSFIATLASSLSDGVSLTETCRTCARRQCFCARKRPDLKDTKRSPPPLPLLSALAPGLRTPAPTTSPTPAGPRPNSLFFDGLTERLSLVDFDVLLMSLMSGSSFGFGFDYVNEQLSLASDTHLLALSDRRPKMIVTLLHRGVNELPPGAHQPLASLIPSKSMAAAKSTGACPSDFSFSDFSPSHGLCADISFVNYLQIVRIGDEFPSRLAVVKCVVSLHVSNQAILLVPSAGQSPATSPSLSQRCAHGTSGPLPAGATPTCVKAGDPSHPVCNQTRCLVRWSAQAVPHPGAAYSPAETPSPSLPSSRTGLPGPPPHTGLPRLDSSYPPPSFSPSLPSPLLSPPPFSSLQISD